MNRLDASTWRVRFTRSHRILANPRAPVRLLDPNFAQRTGIATGRRRRKPLDLKKENIEVLKKEITGLRGQRPLSRYLRHSNVKPTTSSKHGTQESILFSFSFEFSFSFLFSVVFFGTIQGFVGKKGSREPSARRGRASEIIAEKEKHHIKNNLRENRKKEARKEKKEERQIKQGKRKKGKIHAEESKQKKRNDSRKSLCFLFFFNYFTIAQHVRH